MKLLLALLVMSCVGTAQADISGIWHGTLLVNGITCDNTPIEIKRVGDTLTVTAFGSSETAVRCTSKGWTGIFGLSAEFRINGSDLFRYNAAKPMGSLTNASLVAQDRVCTLSGSCRYWDNLNISESFDGNLNVWINYGDEYTLTGKLSRR